MIPIDSLFIILLNKYALYFITFYLQTLSIFNDIFFV